MKNPTSPGFTLPSHGSSTLPKVIIDSYNLEIKDDSGFVGDRANKGAFRQAINALRTTLKKSGEDPFGDIETDAIEKRHLADALAKGDPQEAAIVLGGIENFAQDFYEVIRRYLKLKAWRETEAIVVGGGFSSGRLGEITVARTALLLKGAGIEIDLTTIAHDSDEAGLIGAAHLLPAWMLKGHDSLAAVDIGGTKIRAGIVKLNFEKDEDLAKAEIAKSEIWTHADKDTDRNSAVARLAKMLKRLLSWAEDQKFDLAPVIGIGCPGIISVDGGIDRGGQNLPGNWESSRFNLASALRKEIPTIGDTETMVIIHNDAVVQGLSQYPQMKRYGSWGFLSIGTGLGNVRFSNRTD